MKWLCYAAYSTWVIYIIFNPLLGKSEPYFRLVACLGIGFVAYQLFTLLEEL